MFGNTTWIISITGVLFSATCFAGTLTLQNDHVSASLAEDGTLTLAAGGQPFAKTVLTLSSTFKKVEVDTALGEEITISRIKR